MEQENKLVSKIKLDQTSQTNNQSLIENQHLKNLPSLTILETLINLLNKRANIQSEFKQLDGYTLLQRIFTSIASFNKYILLNAEPSEHPKSLNYYSLIQKNLFVILINGCFYKPVFCLNYYFTNLENIEWCFSLNPKNQVNFDKSESEEFKTNSCIYVINPELLAQVIIEWELWIPFEKLIQNTKESNLYKYKFQILNKLLEDENKSQTYHSGLFLKYNLLEKLMHFLLDANAENHLIDQITCSSLISIFKHFNSVFTTTSNLSMASNQNMSSVSVTKQIFNNFFDYLYILHPENNVYIVNQKNEFYFNLNQSTYRYSF